VINLKNWLFLGVLLTVSINANAEFSCQNQQSSCQKKQSIWSDSQPAINLEHIFCGESDRGRNKGFHSRYLLSTSPVVVEITNKKQLKGGIYSARVKFNNGKSKFSTFFPDHCNLETITRSVIYAATHSSGDHPQWGILGPSAPEADSADYCLQTNGEVFSIRMGLIKQGTRVNTAFPQP
jgi:hypothetical protein